MHRYIDEVIGTHSGLIGAEKFAKADYHGAYIKVVQSRCPSLVGLEGLVIQETEGTFRLMCKDNKLRTVPKGHTVFALQHRSKIVTIYGNHICFRASERAARKFKMMPTVEL